MKTASTQADQRVKAVSAQSEQRLGTAMAQAERLAERAHADAERMIALMSEIRDHLVAGAAFERATATSQAAPTADVALLIDKGDDSS